MDMLAIREPKLGLVKLGLSFCKPPSFPDLSIDKAQAREHAMIARFRNVRKKNGRAEPGQVQQGGKTNESCLNHRLRD